MDKEVHDCQVVETMMRRTMKNLLVVLIVSREEMRYQMSDLVFMALPTDLHHLVRQWQRSKLIIKG